MQITKRIAMRTKCPPTRGRHFCSKSEEVASPTRPQLRRCFFNSAVPFVGFGIMDQSVLVYAGDAIDNTVGVRLGLPTLAAAALGQVLSDTCGVMFGGTIDALAVKLGLPSACLTEAQMRLGITKRVMTAGGVAGVIAGCLIGMGNLFFIDLLAAERAKKAKEMDSIMKTVMEDGRSVIECERASLLMVDEEQNELWSTVAQGAGKVIRIPCKANGSIAGWVVHNREYVNIEDVSKDSRWGGSQLDFGDFVTRSMICAPVIVDEKVAAIVQFMNKRAEDGSLQHLSPADDKVAKMVASHVAAFMNHLSG